MQCHLFALGCCQVSLLMSHLQNQVLHTVASFSKRKANSSLPASLASATPNRPRAAQRLCGWADKGRAKWRHLTTPCTATHLHLHLFVQTGGHWDVQSSRLPAGRWGFVSLLRPSVSRQHRARLQGHLVNPVCALSHSSLRNHLRSVALLARRIHSWPLQRRVAFACSCLSPSFSYHSAIPPF